MSLIFKKDKKHWFSFDKLPASIDLILWNRPVFETGLSDFHLLTIAKFKMSFQKNDNQTVSGIAITKRLITTDLL